MSVASRQSQAAVYRRSPVRNGCIRPRNRVNRATPQRPLLGPIYYIQRCQPSLRTAQLAVRFPVNGPSETRTRTESRCLTQDSAPGTAPSRGDRSPGATTTDPLVSRTSRWIRRHHVTSGWKASLQPADRVVWIANYARPPGATLRFRYSLESPSHRSQSRDRSRRKSQADSVSSR